jgi:hypothetical protein
VQPRNSAGAPVGDYLYGVRWAGGSGFRFQSSVSVGAAMQQRRRPRRRLPTWRQARWAQVMVSGVIRALCNTAHWSILSLLAVPDASAAGLVAELSPACAGNLRCAGGCSQEHTDKKEVLQALSSRQQQQDATATYTTSNSKASRADSPNPTLLACCYASFSHLALPTHLTFCVCFATDAAALRVSETLPWLATNGEAGRP